MSPFFIWLNLWFGLLEIEFTQGSRISIQQTEDKNTLLIIPTVSISLFPKFETCHLPVFRLKKNKIHVTLTYFQLISYPLLRRFA